MNLTQFNHPHRLSPLSPWISPSLRTRPDAATSSSGDVSNVLLVDDRIAFRGTLAARLMQHGLEVIQAIGVHDAWHLARRRTIDLVVIRGNLQRQSGWGCAAKLCGLPPWRGVVMHFDELTDQDRKWAYVSGLTALEETAGQSGNLVGTVLRVLNVKSFEAAEFGAAPEPMTARS